MKHRLCTSCGHVGEPTTQGVGSFAVDVVIWMTCLVASFFTGVFLFMAIAAAWSIYHLALYWTTTCPACGDIAMVNLHSKKADEFRATEHHTVKTVYSKF